MIKNVLENIGGVGIYGVVSICLFFAFFLAMLVWVGRLKRSHLASMSELPLEDGSRSPDAATPTSRPAITRVSQSAGPVMSRALLIWKSALQPVWKAAPRTLHKNPNSEIYDE